MPKLTRYLQKIFANNSDQVGVFGTGVDKETSKNVETLQSADYENGWSSAIITNKNYPIWQEMDGVQYGLSYQIKYLEQSGIPEWLSTETYYTNDYCRVGSTIYYSLQDNNTNHSPALQDGWWTPLLTSNRSIGEIIPSCVPLTESGLHLLDGALITNGMYADFVTYMANLTATAPDCFCTEAEWQQSVTTYGVCGKFVYDSINNTVRLPKWGSQIITKTSSITTASTVPVVGDGKTLGLTNGSTQGTFYSCQNGTILATGVDKSKVHGNLASSHTYNASNNLYGDFGVSTNASQSGLIANTSSLLNITNYPLDCYYYIVVATSTKTDIQVDIDEIATDLNGKADVDLTNINNSCKALDGQWVSSHLVLANLVTAPSTTNLEYSLSSYLPNDNYKYEVLLAVQAYTDSTAGHAIYIRIKSDILTEAVQYAQVVPRTANSYRQASNGIMPVGTERKVIVEGETTGNYGTFTLSAEGYRRIGTNQ